MNALAYSPKADLTDLTVAVLGSARLTEQSAEWNATHHLGSLLGSSGATVVTGGYSGLMRAAAQGTREAGGDTVGLPMGSWSHLQPDSANRRLLWCNSYGERLDHISRCDAVVAVWGGIGTLSEWTVAWANLQTETFPRAIVLVGDPWAKVMATLRECLVADPEDFAAVLIVSCEDEVPEAILAGIQRRGIGDARG